MEPLLGFNEEIMVGDSNDQENPSSSSVCGYKLVPWLNWDEWECVRGSLFSDSADKIAFAIRRISTWRSRGCLPVVIDVTASIIEIQQKDPFYRKDLPSDTLHSDQMLAMLYCMAILRLVNCVVEKTRKKTEISIAEAASQIGIPRTLIDIRHEGSHRDLPALTLVRDSAVKAIDWLKSYYWEPQTEQIPYQKDGTAKIRKEIKSKLRELASCIRARQNPQHAASLVKGKSSKKHTTKTLKILVGLYSSFSSEVLSILSNILLKALDSSNLEEFTKDHQIGQDLPASLNDWKLVITKLSNKEPELILMLLKAILNMVEAEEAKKFEMGKYLSSMESSSGTGKIEQLSYLFAWLVGQLKLLKPFSGDNAKAKSEVSATEVKMSNSILMELLRKCLVVSSCGNKQLMDAALHLAELLGNIRSVEKLTKLSLMGLSNSNSNGESSINPLLQQDELIHQAAKKLELVKCRLAKRRTVKRTYANLGNLGKWSVVESWNPCPIGMLPRHLGSSGCLPVLDHNYMDSPERIQISDDAEAQSSDIHYDKLGVEKTSNKRGAGYDVSLLDTSNFKKMRDSIESESDDGDIYLQTDMKGCMMIDGVWKKLSEDELAISSGAKILI